MNTSVPYKLTKSEKQELKDLRNHFDPEFVVDEIAETVTAIVKRRGSGSLFDVAVSSHCGHGEVFNKKRGKYEALKRLYYCQYAIMTSEQVSELR